jgi:hypothetical protein
MCAQKQAAIKIQSLHDICMYISVAVKPIHFHDEYMLIIVIKTQSLQRNPEGKSPAGTRIEFVFPRNTVKN